MLFTPRELVSLYTKRIYPGTGWTIPPSVVRQTIARLDRASYHFELREEGLYCNEDSNICIHINTAPLLRPMSDEEPSQTGRGTIWVDTFGLAEDTSVSAAYNRGRKIAKIIRATPGIQSRHFVGIITCEGL